jgi:sialic acid synthase SpsE
MKKPGTGIPAGRIAEVVGRRLRRNLEADDQLRLEDLDRG